MYSTNLKQLCKKHRITMSELSKRSSIPQPSLSRYAGGKSDITLKQLSRIALALNVQMGEILQNNVFTEQYKKRIRMKEMGNRKQDKAWVTGVLCDLQHHYSRIKK